MATDQAKRDVERARRRRQKAAHAYDAAPAELGGDPLGDRLDELVGNAEGQALRHAAARFRLPRVARAIRPSMTTPASALVSGSGSSIPSSSERSRILSSCFSVGSDPPSP